MVREHDVCRCRRDDSFWPGGDHGGAERHVGPERGSGDGGANVTVGDLALEHGRSQVALSIIVGFLDLSGEGHEGEKQVARPPHPALDGPDQIVGDRSRQGVREIPLQLSALVGRPQGGQAGAVADEGERQIEPPLEPQRQHILIHFGRVHFIPDQMRQAGLLALAIRFPNRLAVGEPHQDPVASHQLAHLRACPRQGSAMPHSLVAAKHPAVAVGVLDAYLKLLRGHDEPRPKQDERRAQVLGRAALRSAYHVTRAALAEERPNQFQQHRLQALEGEGLEGFEVANLRMRPWPEWRGGRPRQPGRSGNTRPAGTAGDAQAPTLLDDQANRRQVDPIVHAGHLRRQVGGQRSQQAEEASRCSMTWSRPSANVRSRRSMRSRAPRSCPPCSSV